MYFVFWSVPGKTMWVGWKEGWGGGNGVSFAFFGTRMVSHLARTRFLDRWKLKDEEGTFISLFGRMNNYSFNYQERELSVRARLA